MLAVTADRVGDSPDGNKHDQGAEQEQPRQPVRDIIHNEKTVRGQGRGTGHSGYDITSRGLGQRHVWLLQVLCPKLPRHHSIPSTY